MRTVLSSWAINSFPWIQLLEGSEWESTSQFVITYIYLHTTKPEL